MSDPLQDMPEVPDRSVLEIAKLRAEIAKFQAERVKVELEVQEIHQWWRRPSVVQSYAAITVALVTAVLGWANGWFSVKAETLSVQRQKIEMDISLLDAKRTDLHQQLAILERDRAAALNRIEAMSSEMKTLQKGSRVSKETKAELEQLRKELDAVRARSTAVPTNPTTLDSALGPWGRPTLPSYSNSLDTILGRSLSPDFDIDLTSLRFHRTDQGFHPANHLITVTNKSSASLAFEAVARTYTSSISVSPKAGSIAPGEAAVLKISVNAGSFPYGSSLVDSIAITSGGRSRNVSVYVSQLPF